MKKKIGFIDLFIDEWHSNNYPQWIKDFGNGALVSMAWEEKSKEGRRSLKTWCEEFGITPAKSISEVVEKCDAICVLAPANPEVHERLAELPLKSGKPVYIDKPFAPDVATARRMFELAAKHHTPLFSSSALRFATELSDAKKILADERIDFVSVRGGGGSFEEYGVHQLEMLVTLMGTGIKRVMDCGNGTRSRHILVDYADGRRGTLTWMQGQNFGLAVAGEKREIILDQLNDIFPNLIKAMLEFFRTGKAPVPQEETIEIAAARATAISACKTPDKWISVIKQ